MLMLQVLPSYLLPHAGATNCSGSCFGRITGLRGIWNISCTGREMNILQSVMNDGCGGDAGVICSKCTST